MKKVLFILLVLSAFMLTACNISEPQGAHNIESSLDGNYDNILSADKVEESALNSKDSDEIPENSQMSQESSNQTSENLQPPQESENQNGGEWVNNYVNIFDYNSYLNFINTDENIPENFIMYQSLQDLGDFDSLIVFDKRFEQYMYGLIDNNGVEITIYVDPMPTTVSTQTIATSVNENDLREIAPGSKSSVFSINNISYRYYSWGELGSISWTVSNKVLKLAILKDGGFPNYQLNENNIISRLLSTQTATAAVEAFNQKVEAEIAKNIADKQSKG